jgi:23S rRNA (adenine2503-C2)-methyltransferase
MAERARPNLKNLPPDELRARLVQDGIAPYRGDQIAAWLYGRGVDAPGEWTDLALDLRERLGREWSTRALEVDAVEHSRDGTVKARLRAHDGALVESVLIPEPERTTLCLSTQVGCPLACSFCATGAMGFSRNLSVSEIVDQLCRMREIASPGRRITNLVFMGMGEPLLNLPAVQGAIRTFIHPRGFGMAPRRITVSTVGVVPRIEALLETAPVNLAVSLHAATDEVRDLLVPLNRRYPLKVLLGALRESPHVHRRRPVFFEYTLLAGVNDAPEDARNLARAIEGIPCKVNVIPMNSHEDSELHSPSTDAIDRFTAALAAAGLRVTLRRSRGSDIAAACGQLAARPQAGPPADAPELGVPGPSGAP